MCVPLGGRRSSRSSEPRVYNRYSYVVFTDINAIPAVDPNRFDTSQRWTINQARAEARKLWEESGKKVGWIVYKHPDLEEGYTTGCIDEKGKGHYGHEIFE